MSILFGYKNHSLEEKSWYKKLRIAFQAYSWVVGIGFLSAVIWLFIKEPYNLLTLVVVILIALAVFLGSVSVIRYIFLYTVLGSDKRQSKVRKKFWRIT